MKNILELKKKAQRNLRILDIGITIASFGWALYLFTQKGIYFWFLFWLVFAFMSLIFTLLNPVELIEKWLIKTFVKRR